MHEQNIQFNSIYNNNGKALIHQYILKAIWGQSYLEQTHYFRVFVVQLRKIKKQILLVILILQNKLVPNSVMDIDFIQMNKQ